MSVFRSKQQNIGVLILIWATKNLFRLPVCFMLFELSVTPRSFTLFLLDPAGYSCEASYRRKGHRADRISWTGAIRHTQEAKERTQRCPVAEPNFTAEGGLREQPVATGVEGNKGASILQSIIQRAALNVQVLPQGAL